MFGFRKKEKPIRTLMKTSQRGFNAGVFVVNITDKELKVFKEVYERSGITLIIK